MALNGCQQRGQFQHTFLSSSYCYDFRGHDVGIWWWFQYTTMTIYFVDVKGLVHRVYNIVSGPFTLNVAFDRQTISSQLDWNLQIWKEIKAVWPQCLLSHVLYVCEVEGKREGGHHTTVLCLCAKKGSQVSAYPLMRTCVVFHISHPTPIGSGCFQMRALTF